MKILSVSPLQVFQRSYQSNPRQTVSDYPADSFTRTTPSFKGSPLQEAAKKILEKPELTAKFAAFAAAAYAALHSLAETNDVNIEQEAENTALQFLNSNSDEINSAEETDEINESEMTANETEIYKDDINEDEIRVIGSKHEVVQHADNMPEKISIQFPKKHGRLSKSQEKLKTTVEELQVNKDYAEKLSLICQELMKKDSDILKDNPNLTDEFQKNLVSQPSVEEVIDEFYNTHIQKPTEEEIKSVQQDNKPKTSNAEFVCSTQQTENNLKIIGKIDLPPKPLSDKDCLREGSIETEEGKQGFVFSIPGTNKRSLKEILRMLLVNAEHKVYAETNGHVQWQYNRPVSAKVNKHDIIKEIRYCNSIQPHDNEDSSAYVHITEDDADLIADIINSEPRFNAMFSLHGAVRFIERYINFDDGDIETQVNNKLTALEKLIRIASTKGIYVDRHMKQDKNNNDITGFTAIINPHSYKSLDSGIITELGSYPIKLGICENQPRIGYYYKKDKMPLICSICSKGVKSE